jgi:peptidoglycan/xylan/chitin deacetylase (PgdA/CDA1 family)
MARRALQKALSGEVITPIYFHKPSKKLFEESILWLIRNGYTLIGMDELIEILRGQKPFPRGAAWISLDDGYREWFDDLLPVIRRHKVPVTLFIPTGIVAGDGVFPWLHEEKRSGGSLQRDTAVPKDSARKSLTVEQLKQIAACPLVRIGGHTVNHNLTINCSDEELLYEIGECKRVLEQWTGTAVTSFAYPEGRYDGRERHPLAEFDYVMAATTIPSFIRPDTDPMLLPRFCVPDDVTLPEAICNMMGIWRPFLEPIKTLMNFGAEPRPRQSRAAAAVNSGPVQKVPGASSKEERIDVV